MKLAIVGTGAMGTVLRQYAEEEGTFSKIFFIEPADENTWPSEKPDLLIDFSNPGAINSIYDFCRKQGGGFAVVLATTGYGPQEWEIIKLIQKICPLVQKNNFSRGVEVMNRMAEQGAQLLGDVADIRVFEAHHTKKRMRQAERLRLFARVLEFLMRITRKRRRYCAWERCRESILCILPWRTKCWK